MENFPQILSLVTSPELQEKLFFLRVPFLIIGLFFLMMVLVLFFRSSWLQFSFLLDMAEFFAFRPYGMRSIERRWRAINARLETGNEAEYKLAVMEADNILDENLIKMNVRGATLDERLQNIPPFFSSNLPELLDAHKIRSNIVYDPDYRLSLIEARKVLEAYEKTFRELDLL